MLPVEPSRGDMSVGLAGGVVSGGRSMVKKKGPLSPVLPASSFASTRHLKFPLGRKVTVNWRLSVAATRSATSSVLRGLLKSSVAKSTSKVYVTGLRSPVTWLHVNVGVESSIVSPVAGDMSTGVRNEVSVTGGNTDDNAGGGNRVKVKGTLKSPVSARTRQM